MQNLKQLLIFSLVLSLTTLVAQSKASIYGTMSNFDTYNETTEDSYGAEIELEGIHIEDLYRTFPSHYNSEVKSEYTDGTSFGTRITYSGYNFDPSGFLPANTVGVSTNGHACVGTEGC